MVNKLLANLPFNPSMVEEVNFYAGRLRQESSIRRIGLAFIVLSMFVQIFAVMVPPEKSLARSDNDVIDGGVSSLGVLADKCNDRADTQGLYNRFGLDCGKINGGYTVKNISFNYADKGQDKVRTVGRKNFTFTADNILGPYAGTNTLFYSRSASEWPGSEAAYDFGVRKGTDNQYYHVWVIKGCGNIAYKRVNTTDTITPQPPTAVVTPPQVITTPPPPVTPPPPPVTTPPPVAPPPVTVTTCQDSNTCLPALLSKKVQNITQSLTPEQSLSSKAKAGDVLEYTLSTTNPNNTAILKYDVTDDVGDILDYALIDQTFLSQQGATMLTDKKSVIWASQTIPAKGELKKVFRVVMKNPLPTTNQPNATAPDFDCKMQNLYGNSITIPVACSTIKTIEQLPNTGPGTTVGAAFAVTAVSSYFFSRSRLLAKELTLVKKQYTSSGA